MSNRIVVGSLLAVGAVGAVITGVICAFRWWKGEEDAVDTSTIITKDIGIQVETDDEALDPESFDSDDEEAVDADHVEFETEQSASNDESLVLESSFLKDTVESEVTSQKSAPCLTALPCFGVDSEEDEKVVDESHNVQANTFPLSVMESEGRTERYRADKPLSPGSGLGDYFVVEQVIGEGGFGDIAVALDVRNGSKYVCKKILPENVTMVSGWPMEIAIQKYYAQEEHPNIMPMIDCHNFCDGLYFIKVMPLLAGWTDLEEVWDTGDMTFGFALMAIRQTGEGIKFLHDKHVAHCDIKPQNILVRAVLSDPNQVQAKLIDFGVSSPLERGEKTFIVPGGTHGYASPEYYNDMPIYGPECDIWSLGCIIWRLTYGTLPPIDDVRNDKVKKIQPPERKFSGRIVDRDLRNLFHGMLNKKPENRWTIRQVLVSEWLRDRRE